MKYTAEITVLWTVSWNIDESGKRSRNDLFENKEDAERIAKVPFGAYGSIGMISERSYIDGKGKPTSGIYKSVQSWVDDSLTVNQAKKYGFA